MDPSPRCPETALGRSRRRFLRSSLLGSGLLGIIPAISALGGGARGARHRSPTAEAGSSPAPLVVSTWRHGLAANEAAYPTLRAGGSALDAVETGARVAEADPTIHTVGLGGRPDRDGVVTLDACVMDGGGNAGAVAYLRDIKHAVSVARLVMERTPHVMIVGEGARALAIEHGHEPENLLTPDSEAAYRAWLAKSGYQPEINVENHDTISLLARDTAGNLAGCCTTSGLAYKMHGRVGDSPLIGAALFVDQDVGAACATGRGEAIIRTVGSFLVVELMRQGLDPAEACREAIARIVTSIPEHRDMQIGYLALDRNGRVGACSLVPGFNVAVADAEGNRLIDAASWYEG